MENSPTIENTYNLIVELKEILPILNDNKNLLENVELVIYKYMRMNTNEILGELEELIERFETPDKWV